MPYMLNQYSPYPSPKVNYPTGDYRSISRLDRGKAELARTSQLEAEIARKKAWEDAIFQKKLEELQKSLLSGGAVGGSTQFAPQSRMGAMGRGSSADSGISMWDRIANRGVSPGAIQQSKDRDYLMQQQILGAARARDLWNTANPFRMMHLGSGASSTPFFNLLSGFNAYGMGGK